MDEFTLYMYLKQLLGVSDMISKSCTFIRMLFTELSGGGWEFNFNRLCGYKIIIDYFAVNFIMRSRNYLQMTCFDKTITFEYMYHMKSNCRVWITSAYHV